LSSKRYLCRKCDFIGYSASELAGHLGQSNHDTKWAKAYRTREGNKFGSSSKERYDSWRKVEDQKERWRKEFNKNYESIEDPIQIQVIRFFKKLYEKQDMGFNDNEILTMIAIGKKQAKGNN